MTPTGMKSGYLPRTLSLLISGVLLVVLYRSMDVHLIGEALLRADAFWLVISVGTILPITVMRAIRLFWVAPVGALPGMREALRLTLVASSLNLVVPAKAGDLVKSYFIAKRSHISMGVSVAIVVYERLCDLFAVIVWCLVGWIVGRPQVSGLPSQFWLLLGAFGAVCAIFVSSQRAAAALPALLARLPARRKLRRVHDLSRGWPDLLQLVKGRRRWIISFSLVLWFTHLFQIWLFTVALRVSVPFTVCASLSALALMAGQLPLTVGGLGTRDVALVFLLGRYIAPEAAAAMGILIVTRGLVPAVIGLPLMWPYLSSAVGEARQWRRQMEPTE